MNSTVKAIITGIAVFVGVVFGKAIVQQVFPKKPQESLVQTLVQTSTQLNAKLPMQVDADTRLDSTTAGPGIQFTYNYTLINFHKNELELSQFTTEMKKSLVNSYKTAPGMERFRQKSVELEYRYHDKSGEFVTAITVNPTTDF